MIAKFRGRSLKNSTSIFIPPQQPQKAQLRIQKKCHGIIPFFPQILKIASVFLCHFFLGWPGLLGDSVNCYTWRPLGNKCFLSVIHLFNVITNNWHKKGLSLFKMFKKMIMAQDVCKQNSKPSLSLTSIVRRWAHVWNCDF